MVLNNFKALLDNFKDEFKKKKLKMIKEKVENCIHF